MKKIAFPLMNNWLVNFFMALCGLIFVILIARLNPELVFGNVTIRALCLTTLIFCMSYMTLLSSIICYIAPTSAELIKHLNSRKVQSIRKLSRLCNSTPFKVLLTLHLINSASTNLEFFFGSHRD